MVEHSEGNVEIQDLQLGVQQKIDELKNETVAAEEKWKLEPLYFNIEIIDDFKLLY